MKITRDNDENLCIDCQLEPVLFLGVSVRCESCWADYFYRNENLTK